MIADTSRKAYKSIEHLGAKQQAVLDIIEKESPIDNWRISELMGVPINQVTGRVHELAEAGVIEVAYKDKGHTGRTVKFWKAKTTFENQPLVIAGIDFQEAIDDFDQLVLSIKE